MYSLFKFDKWPFRMLLYHGDEVLIGIDRYAEGTRDTLETVEVRPENVKQLSELNQLITLANRAAQLEAERDEIKAAYAIVYDDRKELQAAFDTVCNHHTAACKRIHEVEAERDAAREKLNKLGVAWSVEA